MISIQGKGNALANQIGKYAVQNLRCIYFQSLLPLSNTPSRGGCNLFKILKIPPEIIIIEKVNKNKFP